MIQVSVYAVVAGIAAFIMGFLALYVWKRRSAPGGLYFSLFMLVCAWWALFSAIGILVDGLSAKVLCLQLLFLGNAWVPTLWFFFSLGYSHGDRWLKSPYIHLLWLEPAVTVILELTNPWHGLIWTSLTLTSTPFGDTLIREHGILGWLNAFYTYALLLIAFGLILGAVFRTFKKNRLSGSLLVLGAFLALLASASSFIGRGLWGYLDMTPLFFPVMGTIFAWGVFNQHMFDLVPVARDTFVRSMGHGLLVVDEDGNLADINPAAMQMLNVRAKPAWLSADAALALWPQLTDCWQSPTETSAELRLDRPEGLRWVDARVSILYDDRGVYHGRVITLWDITSRKQTEEALKEAKARAELYLDLMSHDILNMNLVGRGFIEQALSLSGNDTKQQEYLSRSLGSIEKSTCLIENVEKVQKVQSGEFKLCEVDASQILTQALSHYSSMPGVKATLRYAIPADCRVVANDFLYDVFVNLVGNAVKHGGPELVIDVRIDRTMIDGRACFKFTFEDNGQGIPDDAKEDIFRRLQRGKTAANGKGLGLYLVRTLVENYEGRVWAENRVADDYRKGSRFVVVLPAVEK